MGSIPTETKLHNNLGQVVHTYVLLSPSSIPWYWPKDGDDLGDRRPGRVSMSCQCSHLTSEIKRSMGAGEVIPSLLLGIT